LALFFSSLIENTLLSVGFSRKHLPLFCFEEVTKLFVVDFSSENPTGGSSFYLKTQTNERRAILGFHTRIGCTICLDERHSKKILAK
uniref:Ovule protein n=1 Tax=Rodentolepis nana TaxID=102285 RepID=A0A0R3TPP2_RODNA